MLSRKSFGPPPGASDEHWRQNQGKRIAFTGERLRVQSYCSAATADFGNQIGQGNEDYNQKAEDSQVTR